MSGLFTHLQRGGDGSSFVVRYRLGLYQVQQENPDMKITEISKVLGQLWRTMDESAKKPFNKKAAADKERQVALARCEPDMHHVRHFVHVTDVPHSHARLWAASAVNVPLITTEYLFIFIALYCVFLSRVYPTCRGQCGI